MVDEVQTPEPVIETDAAPVEAPAQPVIDEAAAEKERLGKEAQKRIARLTYEREEARREVARLKAAPAPQPGTDFEAQVAKAAAELVAAQQFNADCNATFSKGVEAFPKFYEDVQALQEIGMSDNREFLEVVNDLPNGAAVLHHLGQNLDDAAAIMRLTPAKMAAKLAMLSGDVAKPTAKPISRTPAPPETISGKASPAAKSPENMSVAEVAAYIADQRKTLRR